jgi:hypothetical protein
MSLALASLILLGTAATPPAAPAPAATGEPDPKSMTGAEIRAHNAQLDKQHPYFIRCVRSAPIGSLVETRRSCRTNAAWARADRIGNDEARAIGDQMASKSWNTN